MINIMHGDCLEKMAEIESGSVNLVVVDPPYNIGKDKKWDKWKKQEEYVEWLGACFLECQRVLKDNGSFYFFHNDFLQVVALQNWVAGNTKFIFKQLNVWNKRYEGSPRKFYFDNVIQTTQDRNYRLLAEYCLFYTFQDETGLTTVMLDTNNFSTLRQYFKKMQEHLDLNKTQIKDLVGQRADHCFRWGSSQWDLPTPETYQAIETVFNLRQWGGFKEYEELREEYEERREEYEELRYTFNNQKTHHSVWDYEIAKKQEHVTPKPVKLIENIILHSSNPGDTVLDFTMGSGTTGVACVNLGRNFIGIERDDKYFGIAGCRIIEASLA